MSTSTARILVDDPRVERLFSQRYLEVVQRIDRLMVGLMIAQWLAAVVIAWLVSPLAWAGRLSVVHSHVVAAVVLGGIISSAPVILARLQPGAPSTRWVIACAQMLWSALLIHLTGGRIETHFHVFCSLAILAFYRDLSILIPATIVVAGDHFIRGVYWPESVYGVANPAWWRFLEHAGWVAFLVGFLIFHCYQSRKELVQLCHQQIEIGSSHEKVARMERLAAIGQLAASVGHELRNPLAAIRNANTFIRRKLRASESLDPKVAKFLDLTERELEASAKIISNLLDFSRAKDPVLAPCPLGPLIREAVEVVPAIEGVAIDVVLCDALPVPDLDRDQFRQVFVNLLQNGVEASHAAGGHAVRIEAAGGGSEPWEIRITDDGAGVPEEIREQIFQPLFSTKTKGTGLGLAVVESIVERHGGAIRLASAPEGGAQIRVTLPASNRAGRAPEAAE